MRSQVQLGVNRNLPNSPLSMTNANVAHCKRSILRWQECKITRPLPFGVHFSLHSPHNNQPFQEVSESAGLSEGHSWAALLLGGSGRGGGKNGKTDVQAPESESECEAAFSRLAPGRRPDTVVLRGIPANWLGEGGRAAQGTSAEVYGANSGAKKVCICWFSEFVSPFHTVSVGSCCPV